MFPENLQEGGSPGGRRGKQRRTVGCQSDSPPRRDAAVQVDLLTQQLSCGPCPGVCGRAWPCVAVRPEDPPGGCCTHHPDGPHLLPLYLLCCPPTHLQLPTMPLCRPQAPQLLRSHGLSPANHSKPRGESTESRPRMEREEDEKEEEEEEQNTEGGVGLPVRSCDSNTHLSAANHSKAREDKGEMMSQRLMEEEEEEEEGGGAEAEENTGNPRRNAVGPPIRHLKESQVRSHDLSLANHRAARGDKAKRRLWREDEEQEEEKERSRGMEQAGEGRSRDDPPIKNLTESEGRSHGLSLANHRRTRAEKAKRRLWREDEEETGGDEGGLTTRAGRPRRSTAVPPIREPVEDWTRPLTLADDGEERGQNAERLWTEEEDKEDVEEETKKPGRSTGDPPSEEQSHDPSTANHSKAGGVKITLRKEEEEEEEGVQPERKLRPRRKAVGPPIRYLIQSEERWYEFNLANQSEVGGAKKMLLRQRRKYEEEDEEDELVQPMKTEELKAGGRATICRPIGSSTESEGRAVSLSPANESGARGAKGREHREEEEGLDRDDKQEEAVAMKRKRGEEPTNHVVDEESQRRLEPEPTGENEKVGQLRRRRAVCPPIRYLLQSEEWSHDLSAANHGKTKEDEGKQRRKHQEEEKMLVPAPPTPVPDWSARRRAANRNLQLWWSYRTRVRRRGRQEVGGRRGRKRRRWREEEEQGGGDKDAKEEEEEGSGRRQGKETQVTEEAPEPQRPRRRRVGPPIRYLLESELSHGPSTTNQVRGGVSKRGRKPLKSKAGGKASTISGCDHASRHMGHMTPVGKSSQVGVVSPCCVRLHRL
ncbi:trichohyalin-like [Antennarius striatus]|uniref:trichohyalin-like n=1 Tax=Antennarius striatus TaxID=241820 RepID=UPI0035B2866B